MNIKRAKQEIKNAVLAYLQKDEFGEYRIPAIRQRPILLIGPPGIGKTQIMEQIAGECDLALAAYTITHHTRQSAIGLPFIRERVYGGEKRSVTEYTMSEIIASMYERMESSGKKEGILFIDEINCVSETLAPVMLQFLQGKSFGNQKVPEGWIIVAAGNPPEYNRSVRDFDVVTLDRVKVISVEADFAVWKEYAYGAGIHGAVISYLDIHRENFYRMERTVDGRQFVTARGWEDLSEMICAYERLGLQMDSEVTGQYLQHPGVAKDFANYLELYHKYRSDYQVEEILGGKIRPGTLNKLKFAPFDEHLEVVGLLLAGLNEAFAQARQKDADVEKLYQRLSGIREKLESGEEAPDRVLEEIIARDRELVGSRGASGQNEKALKEEYRRVLERLEDWKTRLSEYRGDGSGAFLALRQWFAREADERQEQMEETAGKLEHAFDFMEAAFGESQEMVVFITELSCGASSVWFLREYDCDRYYRYNKGLLFADREAKIRGQLSEIRDLQNS